MNHDDILGFSDCAYNFKMPESITVRPSACSNWNFESSKIDAPKQNFYQIWLKIGIILRFSASRAYQPKSAPYFARQAYLFFANFCDFWRKICDFGTNFVIFDAILTKIGLWKPLLKIWNPKISLGNFSSTLPPDRILILTDLRKSSVLFAIRWQTHSSILRHLV